MGLYLVFVYLFTGRPGKEVNREFRIIVRIIFMQTKQLAQLCFSAIAIGGVMVSCGGSDNENVEKLFEKMDPSTTGIDFVNTVPENDSLNQFTYHYLYNGSGVAIGDINNDGKNDLYFSGNEKSSKLYLNEGDFKFKDITEQSGTATKQWISGLSMVDVNNDGWLDIYACSSGPKQLKQSKRNLLFINQKDGTFKESAKEWGVDDGGNATVPRSLITTRMGIWIFI